MHLAQPLTTAFFEVLIPLWQVKMWLPSPSTTRFKIPFALMAEFNGH
jgi:hypothetical protein